MHFNEKNRCIVCRRPEPEFHVIPGTVYGLCSKEHYGQALDEYITDKNLHSTAEFWASPEYKKYREDEEYARHHSTFWSTYKDHYYKEQLEKWEARRASAAKHAYEKLLDRALREQKVLDAKHAEEEAKETERQRKEEEKRREQQEKERAEQAELDRERTRWIATPLELYDPLFSDARYTGTWICSPSGKGKTVLLQNLILEDLKEDYSIIVIDCKGELAESFKRIWHPQSLRDSNFNDRLITVDFSNPPAINPLDGPRDDQYQALSFLRYIFGTLMTSEVTDRQNLLFSSCLRALLIAHPHPSLADLWRIVTEGPDSQLLSKLPQDLQRYFTVEVAANDYKSTRDGVIWRLRLLQDDPLVRKLFSARETRFDIAKSMDAGDMVIFDLPQGRYGPERCETIGRLLIAQIWRAASARALRPKGSFKRPVRIYIDEAGVIIGKDKNIANIIDYCRSEYIALHLAHQRIDHIEDRNVLSALMNCGIRISNSDDDAPQIAKSLHVPVDVLQNLQVGDFACFVRNYPTNIIYTELPDFDQYDWMNDDEAANHAFDMDDYRSHEAVKAASAAPKTPTESPSHAPRPDAKPRETW